MTNRELFIPTEIIFTNIFSPNEYDWHPLDIAIMLNNIPMIQLLVQFGAQESSKGNFQLSWKLNKKENYFHFIFIVQPEECRYQSVCQQLTILSQQNLDETIKKSSSNKLTTDDVQVYLLNL